MKGVEKLHIKSNLEIRSLNLRCILNLFMHTVERKSSGSAFQRVGPARENERRPKRSRLCRGTTSNARFADRRARRGTYGVIREAMYAGVRSCDEYLVLDAILHGQPVELLQCGRHASPVTAPEPQHNSGRRALHHLKAVQEAVADDIQDCVSVV